MLYYDIAILSISIVVQHTTFSYDTLKDDTQNYRITQENHFYNICDSVRGNNYLANEINDTTKDQ